MKSHSIYQLSSLECPVCGQPFQVETWLIIDRSERPDLIERLVNGDLDTATCPDGHPVRIDSVLLIYQPGRTPPLIISSGADLLTPEARQAASRLIAILQERVEEELGESLAPHVPRRHLRQAMTHGVRPPPSRAAGHEEHSQRPLIPPELLDLVKAAQLGERNYAATSDPAALEASVEAWGKIFRSPAFETAEDEFRAAALSDAGDTDLRLYRHTRRPEDYSRALKHLRLAVELSDSRSPNLYKRLHDLGMCFVSRYQVERRQEDLDGFMRAFERAVEVAPPDASATVTAYRHLGVGWYRKYVTQGDRTCLTRAVEAIRRAHDQAAPGHPEWAEIVMELGSILDAVYLETGDHGAIDSAVDAFERLSAFLPEDSPHTLDLLSNWGSSLRNRYSGTGDLSDLDAAIEVLERGLARVSQQDGAAAALLSNLGSALHDRWLRTKLTDDLDCAVRHFRTAVDLLPPGDEERPTALNNLAAALQQRVGEVGERTGEQDLEEAADAARRALAESGDAPHARVLPLLNLGSVSTELYRETGRPEELDSAVRHLRQALDLGIRSSHSSGIAYNLGRALRIRFESSPSPDDLIEGVEAFRASCERGLNIGAEGCLHSSSAWTEWALERADWEEAVEASRFGLRAVDQLFGRQSQRAHKEAWLRTARTVQGAAAYALARCNDFAAAVATLEAGRARLLSESLSRTGSAGAAAPPGPRDDAAPRSLFAEVCRAATRAPLVYVAVTRVGALLLLVSGDGHVQPVWLDGLTHQALEDQWAGGNGVPEELSFMRSYTRWRNERTRQAKNLWMDSLEQTTRWLWDVLMGQVEEALTRRGARRATLVPEGLLGVLPLHAAWCERPGAPGGRHVVLDSIQISYTPNARAMLRACARAEASNDGTICVVDNPDGSLRFTGNEVAACLAEIDPSRIRLFRGADARKEPVMQALSEANVAHFATHGEARLHEPLASGVLLADAKRLTLGDLLEMDLPKLRLAVLSACETGLPDVTLPDEVVSLPTGFLQAGAAGVLGSLWAVGDESTSFLMIRFYELLREGLPPAEALQQAQMSLRDVTAREMSKLRDLIATDEAEPRSHRPAPGETPFEHPFHWAAFYYTGA